MSSQNLHTRQALSRRSLLKTGFVGSALLSTATLPSMLTGCASNPRHYPLNTSDQTVYTFLNRQDVHLLAAVIPAVLGPAWPKESSARDESLGVTLARIDLFLTRLGRFNMQEIRKLFDLLNQRSTRFLTTGIWAHWEDAEPDEVADFIQDWKHSRFDLFNGAYDALSNIISFAWYSNPDNTAHLGYGGPPQYLIDSLPQFQNTSTTLGEA